MTTNNMYFITKAVKNPVSRKISPGLIVIIVFELTVADIMLRKLSNFKRASEMNNTETQGTTYITVTNCALMPVVANMRNWSKKYLSLSVSMTA